MTHQWVSFDDVKAKVGIEEILDHYGLTEGLRRKRDELIGLCPFHRETKGSFHASTTKNLFHCFGCQAKGNVLDFVSLKEGVSIREAALLIQEWFGIDQETPVDGSVKAERPKSRTSPSPVPPAKENRPLTFELKNLDPDHPYLLKERGLAKETIEHFGLGFCSRGSMKDRMAIPIHNERGELVAYAGRHIGEPVGDVEKYQLPTGFFKSQVAFNLHRAAQLAKEKGLIVVEGFFDCFRISESGFENVVALMGSFLSARQKELLVAAAGSQGKITLLFDEDEAGQKCREQCLDELSAHLFVRSLRLPADVGQPDQLTVDQVQQLFSM